MARPLTEDEEDVLVSEEIIRTEQFFPIDEVLKEFGYERVEVGSSARRAMRSLSTVCRRKAADVLIALEEDGPSAFPDSELRNFVRLKPSKPLTVSCGGLVHSPQAVLPK